MTYAKDGKRSLDLSLDSVKSGMCNRITNFPPFRQVNFL